ncbi:type II toxin-antitoxin system Phd/YefM family antitoxin [Nocardioides sambongensis]|uniref:type II toxin-antitoxin system Phd/YefM family antitoxin n=1 Tax=Nocardioides sambongensis TaxID=2589074 RepID=UPI00112DD172|nr:type II toxin-antitoxin system Phd/YefM family antitoxin [Nocardioides sambongensis]
MGTSVTPSQLRADIYRLIDAVLETGEPLVIERKGRTLRLVPDHGEGKLSRLRPQPEVIVGDPEDLVEIDWMADWDPDRALNP